MFRVSSDVEYYLNSQGVKSDFVDGIGFDELASGWDAINYGRDKCKVEDAIIDYAERTESGSEAPAPILNMKKDGYEVLDGVQRLCAGMLLGATRFSAYVVKTNSKSTVHTIRIGANPSLNGIFRPSPEWELRNAVEILHLMDKLSAKDIAKAIGRKKAVVQKEIERQVSCQRLADAGFKGNVKKGWVDAGNKNLPKSDWEKHPGCIVTAVEFLESAAGKNGMAEELFEQLGETNEKTNCDRAVQYASVIDKFSKRPDVASRLLGKRKLDRFDVAIQQARGLKSVLSEMARAGTTTDHDAWIADMAELIRGCKYELRRVCPAEKGMFAA